MPEGGLHLVATETQLLLWRLQSLERFDGLEALRWDLWVSYHRLSNTQENNWRLGRLCNCCFMWQKVGFVNISWNLWLFELSPKIEFEDNVVILKPCCDFLYLWFLSTVFANRSLYYIRRDLPTHASYRILFIFDRHINIFIPSHLYYTQSLIFDPHECMPYKNDDIHRRADLTWPWPWPRPWQTLIERWMSEKYSQCDWCIFFIADNTYFVFYFHKFQVTPVTQVRLLW